MKSFVQKITFLLCLVSFVSQVSAQQCAPSKAKIATKTTTAVKKAPVKKPAAKTTTAKPVNVKTNTDIVKVGQGGAPPVNVTGGIPVITFDKKTVDFGTIKTGDRPEMTYNFTNTGNAPLDIDIVSGCDCTELDWTRATVQPGEKGFVKAVFNSKKAEPEDHKTQLKKYVTIVLKQIHPKSGAPINAEVVFNVFIED